MESTQVFERMYHIKSNSNFDVRVWIRCDSNWNALSLCGSLSIHIDDAISILKEVILNGSSDPSTLAYEVSEVNFVNAVEVLLPDKSGYLVYPSWP
jgi:hypothetical protein